MKKIGHIILMILLVGSQGKAQIITTTDKLVVRQADTTTDTSTKILVIAGNKYVKTAYSLGRFLQSSGGGTTYYPGYGVIIRNDSLIVDTTQIATANYVYRAVRDTANNLRGWVNGLFTAYYTSSQVDAIIANYYTKTQSDARYLQTEVDGSTTNELQTLSLPDSQHIAISNGNAISVPWLSSYTESDPTVDGKITDSLNKIDLQRVLNNGNSAIGKTLNISTNTSDDSFGLRITGHGRSVGIDIYNPDDSSTDGNLNVSHIRIRNSAGTVWDVRGYSPVYDGYAAIFSGAAKGFGLQGNGYNDLIMWRSVGYGYDPYFVDYHTNASLNLAGDTINHMAYSNHDHNLYVSGNAKFNQSITGNDSGRGAVYFFARPFNDGAFTRDVGFAWVTLTSSNTTYKAFQLTGDGDAYLQKSLTVGNQLTSDTPVGVMNVVKTDANDNRPLLTIDRNSNTIGNIWEVYSYPKILRSKMNPSGEIFTPSLYLTSISTASTVPDSVLIPDRSNSNKITYVPAPWPKKSDSTTLYKTRYSAKQDSIALANQITAAVLGDTLLYNNKYLTFKKQNIYYGFVDSLGDTVFRISDKGNMAIGADASPTPDSSAFAPGMGLTIKGTPGYLYPYLRFIYTDGGSGYNDVTMGMDGSSFLWWPKTSALTNYQWFINGTRIFSVQANTVVSYKTFLANAAIQAPSIPNYSSGSYNLIVGNSTNSGAFEKFSISQLRTALAFVDSVTVSNDSLYEWKSGVKKFRYLHTAGAGGGVSNVTATSPISSSGGSTPNIGIDTTTLSGGWHSYNYYKTVFANITHTHAESDITNLTTDLAGKQPLDADLTAIAALTPTANDVMQYKAGAWTNRSISQLKTDLALTKSDVGLANVDNTSDAAKNSASATLTNKTIDANSNTLQHLPVEIGVALSDETTAITTGTAKVTIRMPYAMTITGVRANVNTVSTSGIPTVNIKESGTTIFSTKLTIDANEKTSTTAATPAVLSDTSLADDAEITFDIDVAGTGAKGLKVWIIGTR